MNREMLSRKDLLITASGALIALAGRGSALPALAATQITGAGATFPYPFLSKAFYEDTQKHPDVTVNYQSIGSGGGIQQLTQKTVDFGCSDVPMNAEELGRAQQGGATVIQFPDTLGGIAVTYNVPFTPKSELRFTRDVLANIYLGKITKWNDPAIAKLNPGTPFPDATIIPVNRSDGSGTTYHFTDFLSSVSPEWKSKVGTSKSVQWPSPNGVGGKGNEGVAGQVRQTPGSIGYVELAYQIENKMSQAMLQNKAGKWLDCSAAGVKAAAATKKSITPTDFSIADAAGADSWPISGFSWAMLYQDPSDKSRGKLVQDIMLWLVSSAQPIAAGLNYVELPSNVQQYSAAQLKKMKV